MSQIIPNSVRTQVRMAAVAVVLSLTTSSGDAPQLQERRCPSMSQSQMVMDSVLVLLRDGLPSSAITTVRK